MQWRVPGSATPVSRGVTPPGSLTWRRYFGVLACEAGLGADEAGDTGGGEGGKAAGLAGVTGAPDGEVTGVTVTPVTPPEIASFDFLLAVPRAFRVARSFAAAAASCSAVLGACALGGAIPKSESSWAPVPNEMVT
jgi:hypothetical protein